MKIKGNIIEECRVGVEIKGDLGPSFELEDNSIVNCDTGIRVDLDASLQLKLRAIEVLKDAPGDLLLDAVKAIALSGDPAEEKEALKKSGLGAWLRNQKFVDWAVLTAQIGALLAALSSKF